MNQMIYETIVKSFFIPCFISGAENRGSWILDRMDYCCYSDSIDISVSSVLFV